jgi:nitroreductase
MVFQILKAPPCIIVSLPILTPDELLTTTRAVRRRLDLSRPVGREVIEECIGAAVQAPNAGNRQKIHFVVVTEEKKRASLAEIYRKGSAEYFRMRLADLAKGSDNPATHAAEKRVIDSAWYLHEHLHEVPVHVIPCISGRTDGMPASAQAARWGTIFPAAWSFMLAGRARGLGMTFTTLHLNCEREAAELLDIPFEEVMQAGLLPVAYTRGTDFKPAARPSVSEMTHWEGW